MSKNKVLLRKSMKEKRAAAIDRSERDLKISDNLFTLPQIQNSKNFFIYASFGSEVDTWAIINRLLASKKHVFLPRIENRDMVFVRYRGQVLMKNRFGIQEPLESAANEHPDVIILPILAVDTQLHRLGYGGGYYDRFLLKEKNACKIGICYSFQQTDIPFAEEFDIPADILVTDTEIVCNKGKKE